VYTFVLFVYCVKSTCVPTVGRDLALLAACNHTILTYGTFGFWAGFLAGGGNGKRILPKETDVVFAFAD
jgi:hypothetical protein